MADTTAATVLPPLKMVDNGDGTFSLAVFATGGVGSLGATAWLAAVDAETNKLDFAAILEAAGYPIEVCLGTTDDVEINAIIAALP